MVASERLSGGTVADATDFFRVPDSPLFLKR